MAKAQNSIQFSQIGKGVQTCCCASHIHTVKPHGEAIMQNVKLKKLANLVSNVYDEEEVKIGGNRDPFEIQVTIGCELQSEETSVGFAQLAYQGTDLLSLENNLCLPSPQAGSRAQHVCRQFDLYKFFMETVHKFISDTCPHFIWGLLDAGKEDLRQLKPEAWLSSGSNPGPCLLLLVCRVSGFYPKPVLVTWMRGNQEQPGTERSDVLPNADGTWYLRVTLEVTAGEAAGLSCRVQHSSLGDQDIILHWGEEEASNSIGFILLAVILVLALLAGLVFWLRKLWLADSSP
ncbi:T-cell surface glycoprotein CD1a-like [Ochotona princeps]|uniref:T-cell surface glycoprotein CD1a-like n=1 Tax=Ochotona princeps TaxID=9978 RepID=UPI0027146AD6|nr:T-cell surface glycoprotein CD1a-like [Ochotona princeps]